MFDEVSRRSALLVAVGVVGIGCTAPDGSEAAGDRLSEDLASTALAVSSQGETEPNDLPGEPGVRAIVLGEDNFGELSPGDTTDYWTLHVGARTYINVFLGNIPAGSDYDLEFARNGQLVWEGTRSGNDDEIKVRLVVEAGAYTLKVKAFANPKPGHRYRLRAAATAVSRAKEWVAAQVPYCMTHNGGWDGECGQCERTGAAAKPEWDPYRSDCSGYVSWAWDLPAPGLTTADLPSRFSPIPVEDLQPGDILLHSKTPGEPFGHTFLFERWTNKGARRALILEEKECGAVAAQREVTFASVSASTTTSHEGKEYTARRFDMP